MKKILAFVFIFSLLVSSLSVWAYPLNIGGKDESEKTSEKDSKDASDEDGDDEAETEASKKQEEIDSLKEEIEKYEQKLVQISAQEKTLSNKISFYDSQIKLTQLQIANTLAQISQKEQQIKRIDQDINVIKKRITGLRDSIDYQNKVLKERMKERYKSSEDNTIFVLFGGSAVSNLIQKTKYLQTMEQQDNKMLSEMKRTRENFVLQKDLFEDKKEEAAKLKAEIEKEKAKQEQYNSELQGQKQEQKSLLDLTKQDEAKYQQLLAEAKKELDQITSAVSALMGTAPRKVARGEVIGIQGNTGYSFGDHLHFGVYKYSSFEEINGWNWYYSNYINPEKVLKSKDVRWQTGCESSGTRSVGEGDWAWPMSNPTVSQGFGNTCWSKNLYGGKPHPAYDMYGSFGAFVYAAEEGDAYFCRNCLGDGGNGVFIFHPDGYMSLYWHLR